MHDQQCGVPTYNAETPNSTRSEVWRLRSSTGLHNEELVFPISPNQPNTNNTCFYQSVKQANKANESSPSLPDYR